MNINIIAKSRAYRYLAMITLAIALTLLLSLAAFAETEPNDSIAEAIPLSIGLTNAEVNATLSFETDEDYYRFNAVAGRTYVIETFDIQGTGSNATGLWLYNGDETLIADDDDGDNGTGNANARIVYTFTTSGTYFIRVRRAQFVTWQGTYSLRVLPKHSEEGADWSVTDDNEPNDVLELANELEIGLINAQTHQLFDTTNFVTSGSDHDWYHFTPGADRTYVIETFNIQGTGSNGTGLWLYNSSGSLITDDQNGRNGTGDADARIVYKFTTDDIHYIRVRHEPFGSWRGTYSIRILPKHNEPGAEWDDAQDDEPNGVLEIANEISVGLSNAQTHELFDASSFITNDSDYDWYHFTPETDRTYVIETYDIQGTGTRGTGLWLYNSSGSLITDDENGRNGTDDADARIVYTVTSGETHYIRVRRETFGEWKGTYSIRVLPKHDEPGAAWESNNDDEPNGVLALANAIQVGAENAQTHRLFDHTNFITNDSDRDWYHFDAQAGQTVVIETFDVQAAGRATGLWLYDASGTEIDEDSSGDRNTGQAKITFTFTTAGTYYVMVKDADFQTWTGAYSLRVCNNSCAKPLFLPFVTR